MKYHYYDPNFSFIDLLKSLRIHGKSAEGKIIDYYRKLIGKKYILLTNSCRTALYLTYRALEFTGEVITSPLTCRVALDPILESGNRIIFADITTTDLNINPADIGYRINRNTIAIQVIHLGGIPCRMDEIIQLAKKYDLKVIEDCAQSLGTYYKNKPTGSFGDIACFSLIKNSYGIGGGILATNSESIYNKVAELNNNFRSNSNKLITYRILRNILDSGRRITLMRLIDNILILLRGQKRNNLTIIGQLKRISPIEKKIAAHQIEKFMYLHSARKSIGIKYIEMLSDQNLMDNIGNDKYDSFFPRFYVYHPKINSEKHLKTLCENGLEVMHLEQKRGNPLQERIVSSTEAMNAGLKNYNMVHDHLISLPLTEDLNEKQIGEILGIFKNTIINQ